MTEAIIYALISSMTGYIFINILLDESEGGLLDFVGVFLTKKLVLTEKKARWKLKLYHVLTKCDKCLSGQIAFWSYLLTFQDKSIQSFLICVTSAILLPKFYRRWIF